MILKLAILLILNIIISCGLPEDRKYNASEFGKVSERKGGGPYCDDEKEAIGFVGIYINVTLGNKEFPEDASKWGELNQFTPQHIDPSDFDSVFSFSRYSGGWLDAPCQITVNFRNGKNIIFCFKGIIYDLTERDHQGCPDY